MIDDRDRRIAWLERELEILRSVSKDALAAYRGIGMGTNGWNARDRDAFATLDMALRHPVRESRTSDEEALTLAGNAVRLLIACDGPSGHALSAQTWAGILIEAEFALPGLRQAVQRLGVGVEELLPEETRPAMLAAAAMVHADATEGFPGTVTLERLLDIARREGV